jgi:hypothetical protein
MHVYQYMCVCGGVCAHINNSNYALAEMHTEHIIIITIIIQPLHAPAITCYESTNRPSDLTTLYMYMYMIHLDPPSMQWPGWQFAEVFWRT